MNRIKRIYTYEDGTSNTGAMMGMLLVAVVAIGAIAAAIWQPWAVASTPTHNDTTIIQQPADAPNTTIINPPNTTIVNPPAQNSEPSKTEININNDKGGTTGSTETTGSSETTGTESATGGDASTEAKGSPIHGG